MRIGRVTVVNQLNNRISVSNVRLSYTQDRDYYTLDDLGIQPPRRCESCKGCRDCAYGVGNSCQSRKHLSWITWKSVWTLRRENSK